MIFDREDFEKSGAAEDLVKLIIKAGMLSYAEKNNEDYVFNDEKCDKMNDVIAYCQELASKGFCDIVHCNIEPKAVHGCITIQWYNDLIMGDGEEGRSLKDFIDILKKCDGINIGSFTDDMMEISFFVKNLYSKKK